MGIYQDGDNFGRGLGEKRKELLAISSIFDAKLVQKCPAALRFGQNRPLSRQKTSPCGRMPSVFFLKLSDFDSNLDEIPL